MRREWIAIAIKKRYGRLYAASPSMRREWIEIFVFHSIFPAYMVSLHAEGVD